MKANRTVSKKPAPSTEQETKPDAIQNGPLPETSSATALVSGFGRGGWDANGKHGSVTSGPIGCAD